MYEYAHVCVHIYIYIYVYIHIHTIKEAPRNLNTVSAAIKPIPTYDACQEFGREVRIFFKITI